MDRACAASNGNATYGVNSQQRQRRGFYYMAGVAVSCDHAVPDDLRLVHLPAQPYAVFTHPGLCLSCFRRCVPSTRNGSLLQTLS